jgi:hypothetical protein
MKTIKVRFNTLRQKSEWRNEEADLQENEGWSTDFPRAVDAIRKEMVRLLGITTFIISF